MTKAAKTAKKTKTPCECAKYSVLVGLRENDTDGDLTWDEELTTGCPGTLTGRTFAPGHDAKLKGYLIRWGLSGYDISSTDGVTAGAERVAARYGFESMVLAGMQLGREKREAARERKAKAKKAADKRNDDALAHDGNEARTKREAKSLADRVAAEEAAHEAKVLAEQEARQNEMPTDEEWYEAHTDEDKAKYEAHTEPKAVTAKVGRWEYEGVVTDAGEFVYKNKKGEEKRTTDFVVS